MDFNFVNRIKPFCIVKPNQSSNTFNEEKIIHRWISVCQIKNTRPRICFWYYSCFLSLQRVFLLPEQAGMISTSEQSSGLWITMLPALIKTRGRMKSRSFCGCTRPAVQPVDLWGHFLRHLFDVKVKQCSLYSTDSLAAVWPACNILWSPSYYSLLGKRLRKLSHLPFWKNPHFPCPEWQGVFISTTNYPQCAITRGVGINFTMDLHHN